MSEVQINNQSLAVKEFKGQRVITFKEIDKVHGRSEGISKRRFFENKKRFIENEDYFLVKPDDFQKCEIHTLGFNVPNRGITLITESGYLMIVKSLTDDLAWKVQRELVKNYFRVKEQSKAIITVEKGTPQQINLERKTYKGRPVLILREIEAITGITKFNLSYYLSESKTLNFIEGIDFDILKGSSLRRYKVQNGLEGSIISSLTVVYKSAIDKFIKQGYITSAEAINTLKGYYAENNISEDATIAVTNVPFLEQIQAFRIISEDLNMGTQEKLKAYKQIYNSAGLSATVLN